MSDVTLHHLEKSRSHRILWLFEELGLDYDIVEYKRNPKTMRADRKLRELHSLGKAPLVQIGDELYAESGAIIETVLDAFDSEGGFRPEAGTEGAKQFRYWLHYAEGSLMPPLLVALILGQLTGKKVPFIVRPIAKALVGAVDKAFTNGELERHYAFVEGHLAKNDFFAGETFSGADIQMSYPVMEGRVRAGITAETHPALHRWIDRMTAREAWQRAVARGGHPSRDA